MKTAPLLTEQFNYRLPPELIATHPVANRAESRLLVLDRASGSWTHRVFSDLPQILSPADLLILNNTRVRPSAMTTSDGQVEILLLEETSQRHWTVLAKPGKKTKPGTRLVFTVPGGASLEAEVLKTLEEGERVLRFYQDFDPETLAQMPLPPYILKQREKTGQTRPCDDFERYQTVYARHTGSVAAPTAGLHFTPELLARFNHAFLTLHVGPGTFRPVKSRRVEDHHMHSERFSIPPGLQERVSTAARVVAVGTTTVRVLESVRDLSPQQGQTNIFIYPPYSFKRVGALITNFHLPKSTLLMLVCAFAGTRLVLDAYADAVKERYRFFSYGDAMLIL